MAPEHESRPSGRRREPADDLEDELQLDPDQPGSDDDPGFFPEFLRKSLSVGFTGFFMTEEAVRKAFGDKVPRDWVEFFIAQGDRTRAELVDRLSVEFGRVLSAMDPVEILKRLVDGQTIEVSAKIRFAQDRKAKPEVSGKVAAGRSEAEE